MVENAQRLGIYTVRRLTVGNSIDKKLFWDARLIGKTITDYKMISSTSDIEGPLWEFSNFVVGQIKLRWVR